MTPTRLLALTTRALSRAPSRLELEVWGDALACRGQTECPHDDCPHDDEADAALKQHIATSTYPPTPADVRRIAISYANAPPRLRRQAGRTATRARRRHTTPRAGPGRRGRGRWESLMSWCGGVHVALIPAKDTHDGASPRCTCTPAPDQQPIARTLGRTPPQGTQDTHPLPPVASTPGRTAAADGYGTGTLDAELCASPGCSAPFTRRLETPCGYRVAFCTKHARRAMQGSCLCAAHGSEPFRLVESVYRETLVYLPDLPTESCRGCGTEVQQGPRTRNPKIWCSAACRARTTYSERYAAGLVYAPRCPVYLFECSECERLFVSRAPQAKTCGAQCYRRRQARLAAEYYAANREAELARHKARRAARSEEQRRAETERRREWKRRAGRIESTVAAEQRRRARLAGVRVERFKPVEVFARDGWVCGICGGPVDRGLRYPHPESVSLDHVVPISAGGEHSMANTRAAHLSCNVSRGARLEAPWTVETPAGISWLVDRHG